MDQSQFYMMGGQFEKVGGGALKLSEIDFGVDPATAPTVDRQGAYKAVAQQLRIAFVDQTGNTEYYYVKSAKGVAGWYANGSVLADPTIDAGLGFWYCNGADENPKFNFAGEVMTDSPWVKTFDASFRMLVCPYPKAWTLADITIEGLTENVPTVDRGGAYKNTAFQIRVPFASQTGFTEYYYVKSAKGVEGWYANGSVFAEPSTVVIPAGRGCWFKAPQEADVTFNF